MKPEGRKIRPEEDGLSLQKWIRKEYPDAPLSLLSRLIRKKEVKVDGKAITERSRLMREGEEVRVYGVKKGGNTPNLKPAEQKVRTGRKMEIIHEDQELIAVSKPAGIASQPGSGIGPGMSAVEIVREQMGSEEVTLLHRLDRETSGVLVLCRNAAVQREIERAGAMKQAKKRYLCLVIGCPPQESGVIETPLPQHNREEVMQSAHTAYRVLEVYERLTLLEVTITTGRYHQIRRHLEGINCPILGDRQHGDFRQNAALGKALGVKRLWLHALEYRFWFRGEEKGYRVEVPGELSESLSRMDEARP